MPDFTSNYKLEKPLPNDFYNVKTQNDNMNTIDKVMKNHDTSISGLIAHSENIDMHVTAEDKVLWDTGAETAEQATENVTKALLKIMNLESRVARIEDAIFNDITGNPFLTTFDSLSGIVLVKGVWNEEQQRIEC
ncbi:hypothetical protein [Anaeromassilibacillus senegalensis]|uniref:hypothetical protein n=1 Tax=Anaeromassilibacillus senegalensis TaxID=1673717 RepID=UPI00068287FD|nr:hypothetical protein [Anaeromassilibacillus senegalensis]